MAHGNLGERAPGQLSNEDFATREQERAAKTAEAIQREGIVRGNRILVSFFKSSKEIHKYRVLGIDPKKKTIAVEDLDIPKLQRAPGGCNFSDIASIKKIPEVKN